ncbi:deletion of SUV3 suppressor 1(I) [Arabidopsis thaliana]|uniref:26S proteasome complex subunit SEM1 n=1 Tax=Arabidopsis thaliana TaxID=3702 RepID=F4I886_ARATH|nr:deletion of SUV3 suppressor 1(I) [Arabidopsis thaliana]AEE34282.1 deletion of SUV3 suppressor 1(I) [Arabidopsis thaliana]|eukprot:NP_001185311.1 deletion of SUV3 suppressor 1(I) [Arabidopsis thaliana]
MAAEPKAATAEVVKMDLFEDDDEFEEFEINEVDSSDLTSSCIERIDKDGLVYELSRSDMKTNLFDVNFRCEIDWLEKEEVKEVSQQWEDDWDDDDVNDDFSRQLRKELENGTDKK